MAVNKTMVGLDAQLYNEVRNLIKKKELRLDYINIRDFVNKAVRDKINKVKMKRYA